MAVAQVLLLAAVLLRCSSAVPAGSESCTRLSPAQLNCSSSGLSSVPQPIPDSVAELDLTDNLLDSVTLNWPHYNLRNVWLGNNSITHLSLCMERNLGGRYVTGRQLLQMRTWRRRGCVPWAPSLQLLSVERNQLEQLPEGLEGSASLQVLQLSFNRISTLRPGQLSHLRQLKELHLQHNLITSLHPQMFKDLAQLQVLDLSFNMLTSLHPLMYLSLRNLEANVRLAGNKWKCDCSMRSVRRRMVYDSSRGMHAWSVVCASPSNLSGRDLLQLEDDELNCVTTKSGLDRHQDVTVYGGSEILLSCSTQDSMGWTPSGQASVSQPEAGLFITDVAERDSGLYVCVSEEQEVVSVFNLQISKVEGTQRKARSLPDSSQQIISQSRTDQERNQRATQSDLALAVCLSILFTFLVAFILGVLARPCVDVLWKRVTKKKSATVTNTVSTVEQGQYDNGAYSDIEEPGMVGGHRERRVTFSNVEDSNVQYYDTVARDQDSINDESVFDYEAAETVRERARGSESDSRSSPEANQRGGRGMSGVTVEFEHIPDPVETDRRRHSSSSSDSSLGDKGNNEAQTRPKSSQLVEESVQQRADISTVSEDVPHISIESAHEFPGFSSEPFAGWTPHAGQANLTDPHWQDNEEQFEFSDSVRSISPRSSSVIGSFNDSKLVHKSKRGDSSSSSSGLSENETTHYTVNSDKEDEDAIRPSLGFNHGEPGVRKAHSSSSSSSDSDEEGHKVKQATGKGVVKVESEKLSSSLVTAELDTRERVKPLPQTRRNVPSLAVNTQTGAPSAHSSSSSSDSEADNKYLNVENKQEDTVTSRLQLKKTQTAKSPYSSSSSSSDSEDEATRYIKKQAPGQTHTTMLPLQKSPTGGHVPQTQWPLLDLEQTTSIKRRLDIKVKSHTSSSSDSEDDTAKSLKRPGTVDLAIQKSPTESKLHSDSSSSSDSEDDSTKPIKKHQQGQLPTAGFPLQDPKIVGHNLESGWPVLNLQRLPRPKRRLDIKAHKPASDSSSSSDSEDETIVSNRRPGNLGVTNLATPKPSTVQDSLSDSSSSSDSEDEATKQIKKQDLGQTHTGMVPLEKSPNFGRVPSAQWPLLDLGRTTSVKRRLDIKIQSKASDTSSSSDSEDDKANSLKRPGTVDLAIQKTQTVPKSHTDSSSSSDSEDDSTTPIKKNQQGQLPTTAPPLKGPQTTGHDLESGWPVLNLQHLPRVKRRLDIKFQKPASDSSSSSDSEDETRISIKSPGVVGVTNLATQKSSTVPKSHSDSSSSSDSEDDTTKPIKKHQQGQLPTTGFPLQVPKIVGHDLESGWPVLNLQRLPRLKRRLDIKAHKSASESSSSSDSEDETRISIKRPGNLGVTNLATSKPSTVQDSLSDSSSSSDSEDEATKQIKKQDLGQTHIGMVPLEKSPNFGRVPSSQWPLLDLGRTTSVKRRLDIKIQSKASDTSSSSDSEDEKTNSLKRPGTVDLALQKAQTVPKSYSDSSSSSDSEDDSTKPIKKHQQGQLPTTAPPLKGPQTVGHNLESGWPVLNLEHLPRIKRRLDIKAQRPVSDSSSSSDSEDEIRVSIKRPGVVGVTNLATQKSSTVPKSHSDSSSSSDSEDDFTKTIKKHQQGQLPTTGFPLQDPKIVGHDLESGWPVLNLQHLPRMKRRLDIKAKRPVSESSSSSDSEDETRISIKRPGYLGVTNLATPKPSTVQDSSDSSSSSDSEDEATKQIKKQNPGQTHTGMGPLEKSPNFGRVPSVQWPLLDLGRTTSVKRRLDIKVKSQSTDTSSSSENDKTNSPKRPGTVDLAIQKNPTVPKSHSDSSSSSDSEDDSTKPIKKQQQGQLPTTAPPLKGPQTVGHDLESGWPVLNLQHLPRIKRRLDIKAQRPVSESSSSSDSEDETTVSIKRPGNLGVTNLATPKPSIVQDSSDSSSSSDSEDDFNKPIKKHQQGQLPTTGLPLEGSQTVGHNLESGWPVLNLQHLPRIKRRLDIKAHKSASESSSSSDSEDETRISIKRPGNLGVTNFATSKPSTVQDSSDSSSSSDSEDEATKQIKKQQQDQVFQARPSIKESTTGSRVPQTQWPLLDLEHTTSIKRRLDIKVQSPLSDSSSSSDSEDEARNRPNKQGAQIIQISSSDESQGRTKDLHWKTEGETYVGITSRHPGSVSPDLNVSVPSFKPHLSNVKAPGPQQSSSSSSSSESEDEKRDRTKLRREATAISMTTEREFIESPKSPVIDIPLSPKTDPNIRLHKYNAIPDGSVTTKSEINPELESRWATMNLGVSRFRKRLEITSRAQEPPKVPSSPPPVSPSSSPSSESENEGESGRTRQKRKEVGMQGNKSTGSSPSLKGHHESFGTVDLIERQERPLQREVSSSSDSGNDRIDYGVPDLSLGVPRVKRRLNVMAPSPQPRSSSSSSSDSETKVTGYSAKHSRPVLNMPQNRDTDTLITYKRSIFQTTSPTSSSPPFTSRSLYDTKQRYSEIGNVSRSYSLEGSSTSAGTKKSPSRSFDDLLKMVSPSKRTTELPPELKWTGVGRQMPDMPVSSPGRRLDVGFSSAPAEPELPPPSSSSSSSSSSSESDDELKQDRANSDVTPKQKYSSLRAMNASSASARTFDTVDNSSISTSQILRRERRGLSALKVMSSEIQQWDMNNERLENRTSLFDDPKVETSFHYQRSEGYTKPMATQSLTSVHLPAASVDERRTSDMSYGIPSYRRHGFEGNDPPQETPPPIPATPPPSDEALGTAWKSRSNSWKQRSEGTGYYLQQSRYTLGSDPSSLMSQNLEDFLDTSKNPISQV